MLKLKDIFNIDLNSKGGGKLYKKIMRKYNIPKADSKELINEVQNSSSGDGEVKEYYYKFKDEYLDTNIHNITVMDIPFLSTLHTIIGIDAIICSIYADDGGYHSIGNTELEGNFVVLNKIKMTPYFKIIDSNICLVAGYEDNHTIDNADVIKRIGNLENRIIKAEYLFGGKEASMEFLEMVNGIIQEITKEEYEAMITYKP